jgi:DUF2946 family protein
MKLWWRKLAVFLVFLALPLQGAAATIHALSCLSHSDGQHAAQAHDHGSPGSSHDHDGDTGKSDFAHYCCNLVASGLLVLPTAAIQAEPPILESPISLFATLFIPEQPQRPPLA